MDLRILQEVESEDLVVGKGRKANSQDSSLGDCNGVINEEMLCERK